MPTLIAAVSAWDPGHMASEGLSRPSFLGLPKCWLWSWGPSLFSPGSLIGVQAVDATYKPMTVPDLPQDARLVCLTAHLTLDT